MSNDNNVERRRGHGQQRDFALAKPTVTSPGLTAALVYLRPLPRARLLATMANLGVFVREYQSMPVIELWNDGDECDLAIVAVGNDPSHIAATSRIVTSVTPATIALLPDNATAGAYKGTGVVATLSDDDIDGSLVQVIGAAAQRARSRRESGLHVDTVLVGDVRFSVNAGRLECNGRALGLSPVEQKILRRLTASPGVPVSTTELEGEVQDSPAPHGSELRATILRIRRKLEQVGGNPTILGTVRGFGYVVVA